VAASTTRATVYDGAAMKITSGAIVTLTYDLTGDDGEIIETSDISGPVTFMVGKGAIIKGLDSRLEGMSEGQEATFSFAPEEAFGRVEDMPTQELARADFPAGAALGVGSRFEANLAGGPPIQLEVIAADDAKVKVRMIHPLAGKALGMSVKIGKIREATAAERDAGRAIVRPPAPPPRKG
jgi:FKBP-type peptidyl-prolyl cis-trans isomerase SlyD